jgi:hypothetical protein
MTGGTVQLRDCVQAPEPRPWIPPPPPLALDTPIILPDLATLERVADALRVAPRPPHDATPAAVADGGR